MSSLHLLLLSFIDVPVNCFLKVMSLFSIFYLLLCLFVCFPHCKLWIPPKCTRSRYVQVCMTSPPFASIRAQRPDKLAETLLQMFKIRRLAHTSSEKRKTTSNVVFEMLHYSTVQYCFVPRIWAHRHPGLLRLITNAVPPNANFKLTFSRE